jgi:sucrose-phosphate synthase
MSADGSSGYYIVLISVHGLIRGENMELGRDPDTGGQIRYVIELARALAAHPDVDQVDLLTRQVVDRRIDASYAAPEEPLADRARIVRIPFGPRRYLRKESLWPYLDAFMDNAMSRFRGVGRVPDLIHAHYADAGYIGAQMAKLLGVPFVFTGHSLGRVKRQRLRDKGADDESIETHYRISRRIEAEETALDTAVMVVTSTHQEVEEQYRLYENYEPDRMQVIPPGVDLSLFTPPGENDPEPAIAREIARFLTDPDKPLLMAMARPDERKNFETLVQAYAETPGLRDAANLLLVAGNRDDIGELSPGARRVMTRILLQIDRYDLYGCAALPKHHQAADVPDLYRWTARRRGVFVNPALTEPFGLTLIEAAASGVPVVATNDGGPRDIVAACRHGQLIDPLNPQEMGAALRRLLTDREEWEACSRNGIENSRREYSWERHAERYMSQVHQILQGGQRGLSLQTTRRSRLPWVDRILVTDVDNTLIGDSEALRRFLERFEQVSPRTGFAIATGRRPESALETLKEHGVPEPDFLITCTGTEIYYGHRLTQDHGWVRQINYYWNPTVVRRVLGDLPGLYMQDETEQRYFKISFDVDLDEAPPLAELRRRLRREGVRARLIFSHEAFLDIIPVRASAGIAIRYLAWKWGLPPERLLIAGDSGNDEDMLTGNTLGVVVGNYSPELEPLRGRPRVYFADAAYANGILEGIDYYNFFGDIRIPNDSAAAVAETETEDP